MLKKTIDNKIFKVAMTAIRTIVTIFLLILICIIFIQRVSNDNFAIGGIRIFTVITGSMLPEYEVGDMIISTEVKPEEIKVGDNVVYRGLVDDFKGKIVTHKVIEKNKSGGKYKFVTKGISNDLEDPEIGEDQILGKVVYKTFLLSFVSKLINNTSTFFFVIFVPFVLLVFFEIIEIVEERKQDKKEMIDEEK